MSDFLHLFKRGQVGQMQLKNSIIMPAMDINYADTNGMVTNQMIRYYEERAKGGVGLIIVQIACVDYPVGKATSNQLSVDDDKYISGLARLVEVIHNWGAKAVLQLHHAGRQTSPNLTEGQQPVAPNSEPCPYMQLVFPDVKPRALKYSEVQALVQKFVAAAGRAAYAGFDGVQIQGAHGYLVGQFMSPAINKRDDGYGGDFNRRMRFPLEIIKGIRDKLGSDYPILFRYNADDMYPGGITLEGAQGGIAIAKKLEEGGVNCLNISCGIYPSMMTLLETMHYDEGWRVYLAERIKNEVKVPVSTAGVIRTPELAEEILAAGKADFVEIGRGLISDAEWVKKAREGRSSEIRKCFSCNNCIGDRVFQMKTITCAQNPEAGREFEWAELKPAAKVKKIMVVGGGPAGMEAARIAHLRGHHVTLYEASNTLGGQLTLASLAPGKEKITWVTEWLVQEIDRLGIDIRKWHEVNKAMIIAENPDVLIIATGAEAYLPDIPGLDSPNVFHYKDILAGRHEVSKKRVIVAGGGLIGCECALHLVMHGNNEVTVLEMTDHLLKDMESIAKYEMMTVQLEKANIDWRTQLKVVEITAQGVKAEESGGRIINLEADNVVIALGTRPVNELETKAVEVGIKEIYLIGDARGTGKIVNAKYDGAWVARQI